LERIRKKRSGDKILHITGGLDFVYPNMSTETADELEINYKANKIPYEWLETNQAEERFPQLRFLPGSKIIYQKDYGVLNASKAVRAYWRLAKEAGANIVTNERIIDIKIHSDQLITVKSTSGLQFKGRNLVLTTGAWSQKLASQFLGLDLKLEVTQETICYFPPKGDSKFSHKVDQLPVVIGRFHNANTTDGAIYLLPQVEIPGVKIGLHHTGTVIEPDARVSLSLDTVSKLSEFMATHFPYLHNTPITVSTCLYTNTIDHHFYLDRHPKYSNVIIGTGFSGHGFKFGPAFGQILGSLVLKENPPLPLDTFKLTRNFELKRSVAKRKDSQSQEQLPTS